MYLWHVKLMAKAWSLKGDAESAERKFQTICLWLTAGRSSEAAWLSWGTMDWDAGFDCLFAELPQSKVSEVKLVAFMAGNTAESCFYEAVAQSELPETINASFFRSGAANFMTLFMPAEYVANLTGHPLSGRSALYEYLGVCRALLMPGAVVLAGWPALPWGQLGRGARPAWFVALGADRRGHGRDRALRRAALQPGQLEPHAAAACLGFVAGGRPVEGDAGGGGDPPHVLRGAVRGAPRAVGAPYRADARLLERGPWCRCPPRRRRLEQQQKQQQQRWRRLLHRARERARGAAPLESPHNR